MRLHTALTERLGVAFPIIQAPMAGGPSTVELIAAVCEAGGLGFIAAAYTTPAQIAAAAQQVRARTSRPFGINTFAPVRTAEPPADMSRAVTRVAKYHAELGLPAPEPPQPAADPFNDALPAILESGASVFS